MSYVVLAVHLVLLLFGSCSALNVNVIFILADDLGWGDVKFTENISNIVTPTISQLSNDGIILSNYYVQPICTPTRAALISGRYPIYVGLQNDVIKDSVPAALPLSIFNNSVNVTTLPQYLNNKYGSNIECHMIGKWHLGFYKTKYTPQMRGFNTFYGYFTGNEDYYNHSSPCWNCGNYSALDLGFHNQTDSIYDFDQTGIYSTHLFTTKAQTLIKTFAQENVNTVNSQRINNYNGNNNRTVTIRQQQSKNLFLYLPYEGVHGAANCIPDCYNPTSDLLQAPEYYVNQQTEISDSYMNRKIFGGMVGALDGAILNISETLKSESMWNNTILIFSSDNGAPASHFNSSAMTNYPLRGSKGHLWEGGIKGAAFIYSPLFLNENYQFKTGFKYNGLMHVTDWYLTIDSLLNYFNNIDNNNNHDYNDLELDETTIDNKKTSNNSEINGVDMFKSLQMNTESPRTEILLNIDTAKNTSAIRVGDWKLLQGMNKEPIYPMAGVSGALGDDNTRGDVGESKIYLYNISSDPTESVDLSQNYTDVVKQLQQRIEYYRQNMMPAQTDKPDPNAPELILAKGVWFPWQN